MTGVVDSSGRALLTLKVISEVLPRENPLEVWIDTGFTGELVFPRSVLDRLGVTASGSVDAVLADGSRVQLETFTCRIMWFGGERTIEVVANDGDVPLLGVGLLLGRELRIDYTNLTLSLRPSAKFVP